MLVLAIGLPILGLGIVLVPLPGPGLIIMFVGLLIISIEFDWARRWVAHIRHKLAELYRNIQQRNAARFDSND